MAAIHLALADQVKVAATDTMDANDPVHKENPLGKIPVLIRNDNKPLIDTPLILQYLDHLAGGNRIIPADWDERVSVQQLEALGDGIIDAVILMVYEERYRPEDKRHPGWVERQRGKAERGLAAVASALPDPTVATVGTFSIAAALGYIEWRQLIDWRAAHPALGHWLGDFAKAIPAFNATAPELPLD